MDPEPSLGRQQRQALLDVARRAIAAHLAGEPPPTVALDDERLHRPSGAFVTLRRRAGKGDQLRLRGCIGTFEDDRPLLETVVRMAVMAATNDPRFPPVSEQELPELVLEVSVLSARRVVDADDVVVGRDGLYLSHGRQRGVLLPQVAVEYGWDRETFLDQTCRKAGLPRGCWRDEGTRIEVFTALAFSEDDLAG